MFRKSNTAKVNSITRGYTNLNKKKEDFIFKVNYKRFLGYTKKDY